MFDFIAVSATTENRVTEFVDHLHEHFVDPVVIKNARYMPPLAPGYSAEINAASRQRFQFPTGEAWAQS
jgi:L-fuconate dehydratase